MLWAGYSVAGLCGPHGADGDRAGIFTGFVRRALRREVERDNPLFASEALLSSPDLRRITEGGRDGHELQERAALFPKLGVLAYGIQRESSDQPGQRPGVSVVVVVPRTI